jgi:hypothetical protein
MGRHKKYVTTDIPENPILDNSDDEDLIDASFGSAIPKCVIISEPKYTVPKGKSLNCISRIVGPGCVVTPEMVIGGSKTLEYLSSVGALIKE